MDKPRVHFSFEMPGSHPSDYVKMPVGMEYVEIRLQSGLKGVGSILSLKTFHIFALGYYTVYLYFNANPQRPDITLAFMVLINSLF